MHSKKKNCKRNLLLQFQGESTTLNTLKELLSNHDFPTKMGVEFDFPLSFKDRLVLRLICPENEIDSFLNHVGSLLNKLQPDIELTIMDEKECETPLFLNEIQLTSTVKVHFLEKQQGGLLNKRAQKGAEIFLIKDTNTFGSGLHPSTRLACAAISGLKRSGSLQGSTVADVGTGSGILAIYAAMCGAERIFAVDISAKILETARTNFRINGVDKRIEALTTPLDQLQVDKLNVIVANLTPSVMFKLLGVMVAKMHPQGRLVLAGYRNLLRPKICEAAQGYGLETLETFSDQGWSADIFTCRR